MEKYIYDKDKLPKIILDSHPEYAELYDTAWKMAFQNVDYPSNKNWKPYIGCIPYMKRMWQWDSCFMTLFTRYSNGTLTALSNLDNLYRLQDKETGFIAMCYDVDTDAPPSHSATYINPPLMAWVEWENYMATGDSSRFETILPVLTRFYNFIEGKHKTSNELYTFGYSGSSGMDNSPRGFATFNVCHIDLACQQAMSANYISKMYSLLGDTENAQLYAQRYEEIKTRINELHWNEKTNFYYDIYTNYNAFLNHKTAAAFWVLLSGVCTGRRLSHFLEHLLSEEEFNTPHPFASLSKDDPNFDPNGSYWLGGVWPPVVYTAVAGLKSIGRWYLAREVAIKHIDRICKVWQSKEYGSIWECYSPMFDRPANGKGDYLSRPNFVGWSALGPISMLIENVLGFSFDAPKNTVHWHLYNQGRNGIENMEFAGNNISLVCTTCTVESVEIEIKAERPFTLMLKSPFRDAWYKGEINAGVSAVRLNELVQV